MNIKNLKVGDKVFIREDLIHLQEYGNAVYYKAKGSGERTIAWFYNDNKKDTFVSVEDNCYYTVEMIDWEKTIELRREKMKNKDLKVGDVVYIREDLENGKGYGDYLYIDGMPSGVQQIKSIHGDRENFKVFDTLECFYTPEMIDWEKTRDLKINESWENIKRAISGGSTFKEISQSGESGNETTKAIGYDLREITVKNNGEENDIEKAVMLLMLKSLGVTYRDVKKEVEKVKFKWIPKHGEKYYFLDEELDVISSFFNSDCFVSIKKIKVGNYFKTREEAEKKLDKIKEILKGEE